jgi:DNA invertase Pin-like site-specific DNA recombinase
MIADLIPAAQYLRMSTEHQQYSLDNQGIAIQSYAEAHHFQVVQTYTDGPRVGSFSNAGTVSVNSCRM